MILSRAEGIYPVCYIFQIDNFIMKLIINYDQYRRLCRILIGNNIAPCFFASIILSRPSIPCRRDNAQGMPYVWPAVCRANPTMVIGIIEFFFGKEKQYSYFL